MPEDFQYDVSLSHSSKDKAALRPLAERLPKTAKIDEDMERSRVLVLCMSAGGVENKLRA